MKVDCFRGKSSQLWENFNRKQFFHWLTLSPLPIENMFSSLCNFLLLRVIFASFASKKG